MNPEKEVFLNFLFSHNAKEKFLHNLLKPPEIFFNITPPIRYLQEAFSWKESREGLKFWKNLHDLWLLYLHNMEGGDSLQIFKNDEYVYVVQFDRDSKLSYKKKAKLNLMLFEALDILERHKRKLQVVNAGFDAIKKLQEETGIRLDDVDVNHWQERIIGLKRRIKGIERLIIKYVEKNEILD